MIYDELSGEPLTWEPEYFIIDRRTGAACATKPTLAQARAYIRWEKQGNDETHEIIFFPGSGPGPQSAA